jgi:hypothetical protein
MSNQKNHYPVTIMMIVICAAVFALEVYPSESNNERV